MARRSSPRSTRAGRAPIAPRLPACVGLLGGGVIGGGWAARFLLNGVDVRIYDPDPEAFERIDEMLDNARRAYARLTLAPLPNEGALTYARSPEEAVEGAELVQESAPERLDLKQRLLSDASRAAGPDTIFCSSTSGLLPSLLQSQMRRPERLVVGHPFNPVYLLPLVELCAGERTARETVDRAAAAYEAVGMRPVVLAREIDGFVADRLLEALWREALWLLHDDVATVEEIDDAIRYGAGLRWAFMGTFLTYRIAGGKDGMRHFVEQFGPTLSAPWSKLVDVPELTSDFLEKLASQSDAQARGQTIAELERARDDCLVTVLRGLRAHGVGAGETLAAWERDLAHAVVMPARSNGAATAPPLALLVAREVEPEWMDYNGHVTESRYVEVFGLATDELLLYVGVDDTYRESAGSYFTVESHLCYLRELFAGDRIRVTTQLLGGDEKRMHVFHVLVRDGDGDPIATGEHTLVHVDVATGRAAPVRADVGARIAALVAAHAVLPWPDRAGRRIVRL